MRIRLGNTSYTRVFSAIFPRLDCNVGLPIADSGIPSACNESLIQSVTLTVAVRRVPVWSVMSTVPSPAKSSKRNLVVMFFEGLLRWYGRPMVFLAR